MKIFFKKTIFVKTTFIAICLMAISLFFLKKENSSITHQEYNDENFQELKDIIGQKNYEALAPIYQNMLANKVRQAKENPEAFLQRPQACWHPDTDPKIINTFNEVGHKLRHSLSENLNRFQAGDNNRWSFTATDGGGLNQGDPTTLTWSYVPDGTTIFSCDFEPNAPSNFIATFNAEFGAPTTPGDFTTSGWHSIFVSMFDDWSSISGLTFVYEPNDDGISFNAGSNSGVLGVRGDHRIGGHLVDGDGSILACNAFPNNGDMIIDTGDNFFSSNNIVGTTNVLTHEIGHGLGFSHVCPINQTKLMEPFVTTSFLGTQEDDRLGVNRLYGDRDENNNTLATATDLGPISLPSTINRTTLSIDDNSDVDFYAITIANPADITVSINPTGTTYTQGPQDATCSAGSNLNTLTISDLRLDVFDAGGINIAAANANGVGNGETTSLSIPAGTSFIRIQQAGSVNNVQMYEFDINLVPIPLTVPVANFTASASSPIDICPASTTGLTFLDASSGGATSWAWTFSGAGVSPTSSTDQNPTVSISAGGTLTASLEATNNLGTSSPATQAFIVNELPASDATCQADPCLDFQGGFFLLNSVTPSCATGCTPVTAAAETQSSRAYFLAGLTAGEEYTFDICNGYDSNNWEAVLTIGSTDGTGVVAGSDIAVVTGCSITFTCPADGDYACVISEKDNCNGAEITVGNGLPRLQCSGLASTSFFTDPGGASFDYFENSTVVYTLCPSVPGNFVEVIFNTFNIEGDTDGGSPTDCYDILNIYDGNSTAATQIGGEFCNTPGPGNPGTVTSSDASGCLTFELITDPFVNESGWTATVNCGAPAGCPANYNLSGSENGSGGQDGNGDFETDGTIVSTQMIVSGMVDYDSATDITMNGGFEVVLGAVFCAFIDGCNGSGGVVNPIITTLPVAKKAASSSNNLSREEKHLEQIKNRKIHWLE